MLFVLTLNHIKNALLCFIIYGHGKLDLKFVHGRTEMEVGSNKAYPKEMYTSEAEIVEENSRTTSF